MAATVANVTTLASGPKRVKYAEVTLDSSYAAGGEVITANDLGLQSIDWCFAGGNDGWNVQWDSTNLKFLAYGGTTATATTVVAAPQAPSAADLSGVVFGVIVVGI